MKVLDGTYRNNEVENSIVFNNGRTNLFSILSLSPKAVVFPDSRINKKAMEQMNDRGILLCLPMSMLTGSSGINRSKTMYMMSKLLDHALSIKLEVSFVTLARSSSNLCSYLQLIELAKLIGANEEYARKSISETNKTLASE